MGSWGLIFRLGEGKTCSMLFEVLLSHFPKRVKEAGRIIYWD